MSPCRRLPAAALLLAAGLALFPAAAHAGKPRSYSLSYELSYGRRPARATYLDEIERDLAAWIAAGGPLGAPITRGEADLHLHLVFHDLLVDRHYPEVSGQTDAFEDQLPPTYTFSTLFELDVLLVDARRDGFPVAERSLSVFNEQGTTKLITDPKQYSWDTNVEFLLDRLGAFLKKRRKKIAAYLQEQGD